MNFLPLAAAAVLAPVAPPGTVWVGVRPEHLHWHASSTQSGTQSGAQPGLQARVCRTEHLGDVALLHCEVRGAPDPLVVKAALAPHELPCAGSVLQLQAAANRVLCFDAHDRTLMCPPLH
jgi:ABC-type sugar transport system ATPase subunit